VVGFAALAAAALLGGCVPKMTLTELKSVAAGEQQEVWIAIEETYVPEGGGRQTHAYAVHRCTPESCKRVGTLRAATSSGE
jgi:hypothetical protein